MKQPSKPSKRQSQQKTVDLTKRCACTVKSASTLHPLTVPHLTRHASIQNIAGALKGHHVNIPQNNFEIIHDPFHIMFK